MPSRGNGARWLGATPVVAVLLALVVAGGGVGVRGAAAVSASQFCPDQAEWAVLGYVNTLRRQHGLRPLTFSARLGAAAEHHSADMANHNYFGHHMANGTGWSQNIRDHGYTYNTFRGENIAAGYNGPYSTYKQWLNSPGHRANMLSPNFRAIGIARAYNSRSTYDWYWTQTFGGTSDAGPAC